MRELYAGRIAQRLAGVSHYEQVQKFTLIARPFSPETNELTLTLKLRRKVIEGNYAQEIAGMYAPAGRTREHISVSAGRYSPLQGLKL